MPKTETVHINPNGFREYDARWLYPKDINQEGIKNIGRGLGSQIISKTNQSPRVIVGHDYRSYSEEVKKKLIEGLIDTGCNIEDIGLALSPTTYFAQFHLNADAIAMAHVLHYGVYSVPEIREHCIQAGIPVRRFEYSGGVAVS